MSNTQHVVVITTVGTSCVENYLEYHPDDLWGKIKNPKKDVNTYWKKKETYIERFIKPIAEWLQKDGSLGFRNCAEFQTIDKIEEKFGPIAEQHYLLTDTIAGKIAGETLKQVIEDNGKFYDLSGLTVRSYTEFKEKGFHNLVEKIGDIIKGNEEEKKGRKNKQVSFVFNISGGYKAITPLMTIIGQLYKNVSIAYLFEQSNELIEFNKLPFEVDVDIVDGLYPYLNTNVLNNNNFWRNEANDEDKKARDLLLEYSLLEKQGGKYWITKLGFLFQNYVDAKRLESKSVLGTALEVKILEYYKTYDFQIRNTYDVSHSQKIVDESEIGWEVDLLLEEKGAQGRFSKIYANPNLDSNDAIIIEAPPKKYITKEVKSFSKISLEGFINTSAYKQFCAQMRLLKENWETPKEVHYLTYRIGDGTVMYSHHFEEKVKKNIALMKKVVDDTFEGEIVPFKVELISFPFKGNMTRKDNFYVNLLQKKLPEPKLIENYYRHV